MKVKACKNMLYIRVNSYCIHYFLQYCIIFTVLYYFDGTVLFLTVYSMIVDSIAL